jgi:hypothetical protein
MMWPVGGGFQSTLRTVISFHVGSYFCSQRTGCSGLKIVGYSFPLLSRWPFRAAFEVDAG